MIDSIRDGSERIAKLITNLKDFVRKGDTASRSHVDLNHVLASALNIVRSTVGKATSHFEVRPSADEPIVYVDPHQIEQVIMNLLTNAAQALESRDQAITVEVVSRPDSGHVDLTVRDTGPGISPEHLRQIMDPFFTTKRSTGGTGLGLAVSHRIVADHSGTLEFTSEPGIGTVATLRLPLHTGLSK